MSSWTVRCQKRGGGGDYFSLFKIAALIGFMDKIMKKKYLLTYYLIKSAMKLIV